MPTLVNSLGEFVDHDPDPEAERRRVYANLVSTPINRIREGDGALNPVGEGRCANCGAAFAKRSGKQRYCSPECRIAGDRKAQKARRAARALQEKGDDGR